MLQQTDQFRSMNVRIDEDEHSIEMQLPYLAHVFRDKLDQVTFIPGTYLNTTNTV